MKFTNMAIFMFPLLATTAFGEVTHGAGAIDGGGAGIIKLKDKSAWYLQEREVQYCIERDPAFSVTAEQAMDVIQVSINKWKDLLHATGRVNLQPKIQDTYRLLPACDGTQDLRFF